MLEQAAPEELVILDDTAREYFADPLASLDPKRRDEPLGFGVDVALLGPYVLAVAGPVVTHLGSLVAQGCRMRLRRWSLIGSGGCSGVRVLVQRPVAPAPSRS